MPDKDNFKITTAMGKGSLTPGSETYGDKSVQERTSKFFITEIIKTIDDNTGQEVEKKVERELDPSREIIVDGKKIRPDLDLLKKIKNNPQDYTDTFRVERTSQVQKLFANPETVSEDTSIRLTNYEKFKAEESASGRKVVRFKNRVEIDYYIDNPSPDDVIKEVYYRDRKVTTYGDGRELVIVKSKDKEISTEKESKLENRSVQTLKDIIESCEARDVNLEKELVLLSNKEISNLSLEETIMYLQTVSSRIEEVKLRQQEVLKLRQRLEELRKEQIQPENLEKEQSNQPKTGFFNRFLAIVSEKPKQDFINESQSDGIKNRQIEIEQTNSQILKLEEEIQSLLQKNQLEDLVNNKNETVNLAVQYNITKPLIERSFSFIETDGFNKVASEYTLYKQEISELMESIYSPESKLINIQGSIDLESLRNSITAEIKRESNLNYPYGLNALLAISKSNGYKDLPFGDSYIQQALNSIAKDFISKPSYGYKSDFISDPRFLKTYSYLANRPGQPSFPDIDLGTPNANTNYIYFTLSAINRGSSVLSNEETQSLITLLPDEFNPNLEPKDNNFNLFYQDLYKLITSESNLRQFTYVSRELEEAAVKISQLLQSTKNPQPNFLSTALKLVDDEISKTSIFNTKRIFDEINKNTDGEYSSNFNNDTKVRDYFNSKRLNNESKQSFFLRFRNRLVTAPTFNSLNAFLSILESAPNADIYRVNYLIPSVKDNILEYLKSELSKSSEINVLGNPNLFKYLSDTKSLDLFSNVFNSRDISSREDLREIRRLYSLILFPEKNSDNLHPSTELTNIIAIMQDIFPRGIIFKNIIQDAGKLRELYLTLNSEYPFVFEFSKQAKEVIESITPNSRNITVDEFKEILSRANQELKKIKELN